MNTELNPETQESLRALADELDRENVCTNCGRRKTTHYGERMRCMGDVFTAATFMPIQAGVKMAAELRARADELERVPMSSTTLEEEFAWMHRMENPESYEQPAAATAEQAGKPTTGTWFVMTGALGNVWVCHPSETGFPVKVAEMIVHMFADLFAEAGTVYHETGLTPRQLAEGSATYIRISNERQDENVSLRAENARLKDVLQSNGFALRDGTWGREAGAESCEVARLKREMAHKQGLFDNLREQRDGLIVERNRLKEELVAIHSALRNYELNGCDAPSQIDGLYKDADATSAKCRALTRERDALLVALKNFTKVIGDRHYGRMPREVEATYEAARAAIANARGSVPATDPAPKCPKCGSEELHRRHHEATFALPECDTTACGECDWVSEPS